MITSLRPACFGQVDRLCEEYGVYVTCEKGNLPSSSRIRMITLISSEYVFHLDYLLPVQQQQHNT